MDQIPGPQVIHSQALNGSFNSSLLLHLSNQRLKNNGCFYVALKSAEKIEERLKKMAGNKKQNLKVPF